jgi:hypothetical protein
MLPSPQARQAGFDHLPGSAAFEDEGDLLAAPFSSHHR